jgi:hypothetical protein
VKLSVFGSALTRIEEHMAATATSAAPQQLTTTTTTATTVTAGRIVAAAGDSIDKTATAAAAASLDTQTTQENSAATDSAADSSSSSSGSSSGFGRELDSRAYSKLATALDQLQVLPSSIRRLQEGPIGRGGFAKVYKVTFEGRVCAAKVSFTTVQIHVRCCSVTVSTVSLCAMPEHRTPALLLAVLLCSACYSVCHSLAAHCCSVSPQVYSADRCALAVPACWYRL